MANVSVHRVFLTGGTGYVGRHLIPRLVSRGHEVRALIRPGSRHRIISSCRVVMGDPLDETTFAPCVSSSDTFVHLVGVPHPAPWKGRQFRRVDLGSGGAAIKVAVRVGIQHFVYVSVAHPAPVMKAYWRVREEVEALIRASGLHATILRPWYVLGPGHRWPYALLPLYWLLARLPATREAAQRLGLVTIEQMVDTLVRAVECPGPGVRVWDVERIREAGCGPIH